MKTLSLLQPWATLVVIGAKRIETRSWATDYRGPLLIHASKNFRKQNREVCGSNEYFRRALADRRIEELPLGAIIGKCFLREIRTTTVMLSGRELSTQDKNFGDFSWGRWAWILSDFEEFAKPISAKGSLGIWEFTESALGHLAEKRSRSVICCYCGKPARGAQDGVPVCDPYCLVDDF